MSSLYSIRKATKNDSTGISTLLNYRNRIHRHLDWRTPYQLLGFDPFWILETQGSTAAALACFEDIPGVAWVRFFGSLPHLKMDYVWKLLFEKVLEYYGDDRPEMIASVAVSDWYDKLLKENHFEQEDNIVVLTWKLQKLEEPRTTDGLVIKKMTPYDLEEVCRVDNGAFSPLWQFTFENLREAYKSAGYATIALLEDKIVGYQISSMTFQNAHLARLAVLPDCHRKGIAYHLVHDLLRYATRLFLTMVSVNTQGQNEASLALYRKIGFEDTGEQYPVNVYRGK